MNGPYRNSSIFLPTVEQQMIDTCKFLHAYRKCKPVVAGGALWSWAAGNLARDVDIFVEYTWINKYRLSYFKYLKDSIPMYYEISAVDEYSFYVRKILKTVTVYKTNLACGTQVDIVFTPKPGYLAHELFDYEHCMVSFGNGLIEDRGVEAYTVGELRYDKEMRPIRSSEHVLHKTQPTLWGKPNAEKALQTVFYKLFKYYSDISKKKIDV